MVHFQTLVKKSMELIIESKVNNSYSIAWATTLYFQIALEKDN